MAEGTVRVKDFRSQFILQKKLARVTLSRPWHWPGPSKVLPEQAKEKEEGEVGFIGEWGTPRRKLRMGVKGGQSGA